MQSHYFRLGSLQREAEGRVIQVKSYILQPRSARSKVIFLSLTDFHIIENHNLSKTVSEVLMYLRSIRNIILFLTLAHIIQVRGNLHIYHAYIAESYPPNDQDLDGTDLEVKKKLAWWAVRWIVGGISNGLTVQPSGAESEPGWEMLDGATGGASGENVWEKIF
jgi:hypothetical protein